MKFTLHLLFLLAALSVVASTFGSDGDCGDKGGSGDQGGSGNQGGGGKGGSGSCDNCGGNCGGPTTNVIQKTGLFDHLDVDVL